MPARAYRRMVLIALAAAYALFSPPSLSADEQSVAPSDSEGTGIALGGALRFQYSNESYAAGNRRRRGDFDFDTFILSGDGEQEGLRLSFDVRHYPYMNVVKHGWIGYDLNPRVQLQAGVVKVPFGNLPLNSHTFFFSTNYYAGLEDDYDLGVRGIYQAGPWRADLAILKNDELGGVDGFASDRTHRYSYDVLGIRAPDEGAQDAPTTALGEVNTAVARLQRTFSLGPLEINASASGLYGELHEPTRRAGDSRAWALGVDADYARWNLKAQLTDYHHRANGAERIVVGAYAGYDTIPAAARIATLHLARAMAARWGPVHEVKFYANYSRMYAKTGIGGHSWKQVLGVQIDAGPVSIFVDYMMARDHPFIGGSLGEISGERQRRLNVNVGYYF